MATDESIFLQLDDDPEQVAEWLVAVLPFERLSGGQDEVVLRGAAATVDGWLRVAVSRNIYVSPDAGPDELQAIDAYPIEIGIRYKPDEVLRREARLAFDKLVEARPEIPMLLVHEVTILDAAHLPGTGTQYFEESVTVDAPDQDKWREWVRS
ncbi:hypothetical protein [Streptomyces sp. SID13031]|uniref:hypothetical protein n=1 Tax=Streptomyces sp. SID13031 TaxID=2706046 RepID=UPI0013CA53F7|nr:hypothetical protein [Streptomyces sp. SID13031]NEA30156.1 hypothetical protein [Streptomyces sp. SID13031]